MYVILYPKCFCEKKGNLMNISNVISLLGGVALFLFGMSLMGEGLKKVAGNKLEVILWKLTNTPWKGILLGTLVTAVIQSSSATTVMVVGFVNSGMMKVAQAIGIIMGANIGTSITGWILCLSYVEGGSGIAALFSTATLSAVIAIIGILFRMISKSNAKKHVGDIMLGFSVLMFGMQSMSASVAPLKESELVRDVFTKFSNPVIGIIVGILITAVLQSASAAVGILQALSVTGNITFGAALPIIMGMGIGAACPVLLSSIGTNQNGKRTAFVYLLNDVFGMLVWSVIFYSVNAVVRFDFLDTIVSPVGVALINTVFRMLTVLVLSPFIKYIEKLVCFMFKDKEEDPEDLEDVDRLEERFIANPALAIEQSRIVISSMARKAKKNLNRAINLFTDYSEEGYEKVKAKEDVIDRYEDKLGTYLVKLTGRDMSPECNREMSKILHTISDFERIGDHAVNLAESAKEKHTKQTHFSDEGKKELDVLTHAVFEIVDISFDAFVNNDMDEAYKVEPLEEWIDVLCDELKMRHITRIGEGLCTLDHGFLFNDIITNYERIADHCSNLAVAMIELQSEDFRTHEYVDKLKEIKNNNFELFYNQYKERFSL